MLTLAALLVPGMAVAGDTVAQDKGKVFATTEKGFGRLIIEFPARFDLPKYKIHSENAVLSLEFETPVDLTLPDVAAALPDFVTIARIDPDHKGVRFGLRSTLTVNHIEAGEQLFVDLMPSTWQGLPPSLPPEVVAGLSARAKQAAILAEQQRKADEVKLTNPRAELRVGRNPTFMRVEFDWNADTSGKFNFSPKTGDLDFDWPVPIDLYLLKAGLPKELLSVENGVGPDGSHVVFHVADKVVPRFYAVSNRHFIVDIDTPSTVPTDASAAATATAKAFADASAKPSTDPWWLPGAQRGSLMHGAPGPAPDVPQLPITPTIATVGSTVRVTFPFDRDTSAAVFRRGDTVWMLFDTVGGINQPTFSQDLASLAKSFTVVPAGDTQVVRLDLAGDRLATLGSEGKSWVLSLGDMLLAPTEPVTLSRRTDKDGRYQVTANLERPAKIHQFRDPVVGDTLTVITAYPPARGLTRDLGFVDFDALQTVHGLVIKPQREDVAVGIDQKLAVITAPDGLTVSAADAGHSAPLAAAASRDGFIDLNNLHEDDPVKFGHKAGALAASAARADGKERDLARLDLARFYLANNYSYEAIGVLGVLKKELKTPDLTKDLQLTLAAADVLAGRPKEALPILNSSTFTDDPDAALWRTITKVDAGDFVGARLDAIAAAGTAESYPSWLRTKFQLAATRAAIEADDNALAEQLHKSIEFPKLGPEQVTEYQLLNGRMAESEGRLDEALDAYGQVIAADVRPTRAEAVYRTLLILDKTGKIDLGKATKTLAAEAMLWRGNSLEADMDKLLAEFYFRHGDYRLGFETVKQTVQYFPESKNTDALGTEAQDQFAELYLNGKADQLVPVEALSLYYDFRGLTPPGGRGDAMIRNLAARLVKVDLLSQAAQLLQYQIDNRLQGAAQAQIATDLAIIQIANRQPQNALETLSRTQLADVPPALDRQRRILQARALIDSNRNDLALDLLSKITGRDADLLRVEANWNGKYYDQASSLLEVIYAPDSADSSGPALTQAGRMNIVKAAVGFALAGDTIGLSRLRQKYSDVMSKAAEWPMFDYVTSQLSPVASPEFKKVARSISDADTLNAFLAGYKSTYGQDNALAPSTADATAQAATPAKSG
jgi:hypothetical protein